MTDRSDNRPAFAQLADEFVDEELAANPVLATLTGRPEHDAELPDLSEAGLRARFARENEWAARFAGLDDSQLTAEERIDRDLVVMSLRKRQLLHEWGEWQRSPDTYVQTGLNGVQLLFVHRIRPEPELVDAAVSRLESLAELLDAARRNLQPELASPLIVKRAARQARAAVGWMRGGVPDLAGSDADRARLAAAGERAATAYEAVAGHLEELAEKATGDWAVGEALYDALLHEAEGLTFGARELRERGRASYDELAGRLTQLCGELRGDDDWAALIEQLAGEHPATADDMRASYAEWTERARRFCLERDLVTLPDGERCEVEASPPFQRAVMAVAYYIRPPVFADSLTGHFFVPYPPDGATPEEVEQRLAGNAHFDIPTTAVHEAYPGHHWHLSWFASRRAAPVRRILSTSYFTEGWALYAEDMFREHGFFTDPRQVVGQVNARLFRAARIVVDTSLHLGEMSYDEAVEFMRVRAGLPDEVARHEVTRYCAWPTQAASYLTGALEVARMRDRWLSEGRGTLKEFHDRLAGSGSLPIALAERAVFG